MSKFLNLAKYGAIKFDFKALSNNLAGHVHNVKIRKADGDPERVVKYWESFKRTLYEADEIRKAKNSHSKNRPTSQEALILHKQEGAKLK